MADTRGGATADAEVTAEATATATTGTRELQGAEVGCVERFSTERGVDPAAVAEVLRHLDGDILAAVVERLGWAQPKSR